MLDLRRGSPTAGATQMVVLGEGRDAWLKIPPGVAHGYRPLTVPCGLFYVVTRCFDRGRPRRVPRPLGSPRGQGPVGRPQRVADGSKLESQIAQGRKIRCSRTLELLDSHRPHSGFHSSSGTGFPQLEPVRGATARSQSSAPGV